MNPTRLTTKLEDFRNRNCANYCYVNKDIYRIFYSRELYYIAYNKIKSDVCLSPLQVEESQSKPR